MKNLILTKQTGKQLDALNKQDRITAKRVALKIKEVQHDPQYPDSKALANATEFSRVRVGKHRIIYRHDEENLYIILICKRDEIYKLFNRLD